jgi:hypothetical protein
MAQRLTFAERLARELGIKHRREERFAAHIRQFEEQKREFRQDIKTLERQLKRDRQPAARSSAAERARLQGEIRDLRRELRNARRSAATTAKKLSRSTTELARSVGATRVPETTKGLARLAERAGKTPRPPVSRLERYANMLHREYRDKHPNIRAQFLALPRNDQLDILRESDELHQDYVDAGREPLGLAFNPLMAYH